MIAYGDVVWTDFGDPRGSEAAKVLPAIVLQENWLLASTINTVIVVPLTSNLRHESFPGNVLVPAVASALGKDSIALVAHIGPVSREYLEPHPVGTLPTFLLKKISAGVRLVTGI